ncbi:hypothetical protein PS900_02473 [Pseudomonas fluorescens]|uniref:Uncharacterized protein n=1 Tax=Pseudomonas fluorescens TaxID=294 RepID=A0A8H2NS32_PSEFL|nr:hypothetical protein PS900_02473 [Pseudomonas fluorescens]
MAGLTPSRAGSLLQLIVFIWKDPVPCRSEPARDEAITSSTKTSGHKKAPLSRGSLHSEIQHQVI